MLVSSNYNNMRDNFMRYFKDGGNVTNIIIILGGTNDCLYGFNASRVASAINGLHSDAKFLLKSAKMSPSFTIAVTMPFYGIRMPDVRDNCRLETNKLIRDYSLSSHGSTWLFDMENFSFPQENYPEMWSPDKLHLSGKGYEKMGFELFEIIKLHLGHK